jgi:hypothetical protein
MSAQTIRFPKAMKRGAKVKRGPMAAILAFPTALVGYELCTRWAWLNRKHSDWRNESIDGADDDAESITFDIDFARRMASTCGEVFSEDKMRSDVRKWTAIVEKRVRVKDWVESLGVDWVEVKSAEHALCFVFDRFHARGLPPAA